MAHITDVEIQEIVGHVYWTAFDDGRIIGKDKSPRLKDFKRADAINHDAIRKIRRLIKKAQAQKAR